MDERRKVDRRGDVLLSDQQVALLVNVSVRTIRYWRLAGILPSVKVGRHPRIWKTDFYKVFHKPHPEGPWELAGKNGKMPIARDVRSRK